jgi:hypothetical protein
MDVMLLIIIAFGVVFPLLCGYVAAQSDNARYRD